MNLSVFFAKNSVRSQSVHFPFGGVVFQQGQAGEAFYIVQSGRLRVIKQDANGTPVTVGYLYAGDHFGEGALLSRQGHRATVRAVENAEVLQVPKDEFFKAGRKSSDVTGLPRRAGRMYCVSRFYAFFERRCSGRSDAGVVRTVEARGGCSRERRLLNGGSWGSDFI